MPSSLPTAPRPSCS
ncbi:unnamed protein product, partial [Rotaria magnacalcarata]